MKYKKGDIGPDGKIFWTYRKRGRNRDGPIYEVWHDEKAHKELMKTQSKYFEKKYKHEDGIKRINPDTGDIFRIRDKRPSTDKQDGKLFFSYRAKRFTDKNGYRLENWYDKSQYEKLRINGSKSSRKSAVKRKQLFNEGKIKKRINSDTGREFSKGDIRPKSDIQDGKRFWGYVVSTRTKDNFLYERWFSEYDWHYRHIYNGMMRIRLRAKKENILEKLDVNHLIDIFPNDFKCPILGLKLEWGGRNSDVFPSLDRYDPKKGYINSNVAWISSRANRIKYNATYDEIELLYKWMKSKI